MILAVKLLLDDDIDCSDEAKQSVLALNLRVLLWMHLFWEDIVESLQKANNKV